jgi:hypothetical protein
MHSAGTKIFQQIAPIFQFYFVVVVLIKSPMKEFLIDCSFKSYSMASKFDRLIQRYAILIPRYAAYRRIMAQRYAA